MAAKLEEITGVFINERNRFENADGDVIIATIRANGTINGPVTIKGQADADELCPNQTYRFYGSWSDYKNKRTQQTEKQFSFLSFVRQQPAGRTGIISYLQAAGEGHGLGRVRATKLWDIFGSDAVRVFREDPARVVDQLRAAALPVHDDQATAISIALADDVAMEGCSLDLIELLSGRGFRKTLSRQVIRDMGNEAAKKIRENPFVLLPYPGCGFKSCDALWAHLGLPLDSIIRQAYCVWNACNTEREGSSWISRAAAEAALKGSIASAKVKTDEAITYAIENGLISECYTKGSNGPIVEEHFNYPNNFQWLALRSQALAEEKLSQLVSDAMDEPFQWPAIDKIKNIDKEQPEVLSLALRGPIAILGGRPGTGKTFTAANIIKACLEMNGDMEVGIGAPTNMAARRLTQAMEKEGVLARARTNHSLLGRPTIRGEQWRHNERNPFPFKILIMDEESMKDLEVACAIFQARAKGTVVLLIGDINQLPPVGRGAPLRDLIAAGLPYGELTEIRRNSGGIVEACKAIAEGKPWGPGDNLQIIEIDDERDQQEAVVESLRECREAGFDPVWESRVIVAKNDSRRALNKLLQGELNQNPPVDGSPFRIGDKVINREGTDFPLVQADASDQDIQFSEKGDAVRVDNGELGRVLEIHQNHFIIEVLCPKRIVKVKRGQVFERSDADGKEDKTGTGCSFDLGYAITFHSSQGSEFPWAICVASTRDGFMLYRELPYTGFSRAKAKCVVIGKKEVWDKACRRVALPKRKTFLKERILLAQAKKRLANL